MTVHLVYMMTEKYVIYFTFDSDAEISSSTLIGDGNIVICEEQEYYSDKL